MRAVLYGAGTGGVNALRHNKWWTPQEVARLLAYRAAGATHEQIAYELGRTRYGVERFIDRNVTGGRG